MFDKGVGLNIYIKITKTEQVTERFFVRPGRGGGYLSCVARTEGGGSFRTGWGAVGGSVVIKPPLLSGHRGCRSAGRVTRSPLFVDGSVPPAGFRHGRASPTRPRRGEPETTRPPHRAGGGTHELSPALLGGDSTLSPPFWADSRAFAPPMGGDFALWSRPLRAAQLPAGAGRGGVPPCRPSAPGGGCSSRELRADTGCARTPRPPGSPVPPVPPAASRPAGSPPSCPRGDPAGGAGAS